MNTGNQDAPDPEVEKLVKWVQDDARRDTRRQEIDMERSELSAQWAEADERGDTRLCEDIERRMSELLEARRELG
jgi:hypothetical protein